MASASSMFGWNLTFKSIENSIKKKSDVLIAFIHWNLTKRGVLVIGIGQDNTFTGEEEGSELLPSGWNDEDSYKLKYAYQNKLYIIHGILTDSNLIVNLLRPEDLAVSNIALKIDTTVCETSGTIEKMIPTYKELMFNIKRDLIEAVLDKPTNTTATQTTQSETIPQRGVPLIPQPGGIDNRSFPNLRDWSGTGVGRNDLDPFSAGGGGMLFDPRRPQGVEPGFGIPGGLPRGAVPPGARFDPFGPPPGPGSFPGQRRPPPDADHLPPPGQGNFYL